MAADMLSSSGPTRCSPLVPRASGRLHETADAPDGRGGRRDHSVRERCLWLIPGPGAPAAAGARRGGDEAGELEGGEVRVGAENALPDLGALELRKPKQGKGETGIRAGN